MEAEIKTEAKAPEGRNFPFAKARRWKSKLNGKHFKVVPWFQPIDNESRLDFKGLFKEIEPTLFTDDFLANFNVYSGLVIHLGWQIYNDAGVWFCIQMGLQEHYEDLGDWKDEDGKSEPAFPLTKQTIAEAEARDTK